jgi:general secretion pathway protein F
MAMTSIDRTIAFRAYRPDGEIEAGEIRARDEAEAVRLLRQAGKIPFQISGADPADPAAPPRRPAASGGSLFEQRLDLARFFNDLAVMLGAGFTIDVGLRAVADAETDPRRRERIVAIHARMTEGRSIADAFAGLPEMPRDAVALLASGESSGRIDVVIANLAEAWTRRAARQREVTEALLYPAFLVIVMFCAFLLLALYLAPALQPIFENAGVEPPFLVRTLVGFGAFVTGYGLLALGAGLALLAAALVAGRTEGGRERLDGALLRLPGVAGLRRGGANARYLGTMALLLGNGVPMLDAMRLAADTGGSRARQASLMAARQRVSDGEALWSALAESGELPDFVVSLVRLGEQSDNLAPMLGRAGAILDTQVQRRLSRLLTFLTPAITLFLGAVVGGRVVSVMTTLLSINEIAIQ